jgi:hypothetical protein
MAKYKNYKYSRVPLGKKKQEPVSLENKRKAISQAMSSINIHNTDQTNEFIRVKVILNELNKRMRKKPVEHMVKVINYWLADI